MKIYSFSDVSPISEVAFYQYGDRLPVASLTASPAIPAESLIKIRKEIETRGWECVPVTVDGRDVLQVNGFKNEAECNAFLTENKFITGTPTLTDGEQENKKPPKGKAISEFIQRHSLQLAGALNLIGDIGFLARGIKGDNENKKDTYKILGGSFYTLGGLNLSFYGRSAKPEQNLRKVSQRTIELIEQVPGGVPENSSYLHEETPDSTKNFLYRNAANNTLAAYTAGAGAMFVSGLQKRREGKGSAGLYYGLSSIIFKLASFLIPEKAQDDGYDKDSTKKAGIFSKIADWVKEKPLRIFGYGSLITDGWLALDTYQDFRSKQKGYLWTAMTTVTYLMADWLMAHSNKDPENAAEKFDPFEQRQILGLAAEAIAKHPEEQRELLEDRVAKFLVTQPEMKGAPEEIRASIRKQVKDIGHNPWVTRIMNSEPPQPETQPSR